MYGKASGSIATAGSFPQTAAGNQAYHDDKGKCEIWTSSFPWNVEHKTKQSDLFTSYK